MWLHKIIFSFVHIVVAHTSLCMIALQVTLTGVSEAPSCRAHLTYTFNLYCAMIRNESNTVPFRELEKNCEQVFRMNPSYWHLYTDGRNSEILFRNEEELKEAMNMIAIACISFNDVKVFTFELMNNHLHAILAGPPSSCELMFLEIKKKLREAGYDFSK